MSHVVDKIRKLLAMADGTENEAEASAFAEKAAALLASNNLSMQDISEEEKGEMSEHMWETKYLDPWRRRIIEQSALLYFCDCFFRKWWDHDSRRGRWGIVIVGRPHNAYIAKMMATYLIDTTLRLASAYSFSDEKPKYLTRRGACIGFERGCGEMLAHRLHKLRIAKSEGDRVYVGGNPGNLPALYATEADLAMNYIKSLNLKVGNTRASDLETAASAAGIRAAKNISLEPQLTKTSAHLLESKS